MWVKMERNIMRVVWGCLGRHDEGEGSVQGTVMPGLGQQKQGQHSPRCSVWAKAPPSLQTVAEAWPAAPPHPGCLGSRFQVGDLGC